MGAVGAGDVVGNVDGSVEAGVSGALPAAAGKVAGVVAPVGGSPPKDPAPSGAWPLPSWGLAGLDDGMRVGALDHAATAIPTPSRQQTNPL